MREEIPAPAIYFRQVICKITERHGDFDVCLGQSRDPTSASVLAALIRIHYLWLAVFCNGVFQRLNAEACIQRV